MDALTDMLTKPSVISSMELLSASQMILWLRSKVDGLQRSPTGNGGGRRVNGGEERTVEINNKYES